MFIGELGRTGEADGAVEGGSIEAAEIEETVDVSLTRPWRASSKDLPHSLSAGGCTTSFGFCSFASRTLGLCAQVGFKSSAQYAYQCCKS